MGKDDTYRKVDREKYDRTYVRVFGEKCPHCKGSGRFDNQVCRSCHGKGKIYDYDKLKRVERKN